MKFNKFIYLFYILLIFLICFNTLLIHLKIHYRIVVVNPEQSEYLRYSDFFNFDDFNGTDILIKKITMYDRTRNMALWERYNFQSLYIKYINNDKTITKYVSSADIHSTELYEFIIKNNIFENFNIHTMLVCIVVCFILLFIVTLIKIAQHLYRVL